MRDAVLKYALENAVKYEGKANIGSVIGSVIRDIPDAKKNISELKKIAAEIVSEVNSMTPEEQLGKLKEIAPELLEKESSEKDIFEGFDTEGKVITAFPPEPSKYPHIGHAKSLLLNYEFARRNNGKFILRFEDTNPELAKEEYYKIHLNDYKWLGVEPDEILYASDFMDDFYKYAEKLILSGDAYVCSCPQENVKEDRMEGNECEHRSQDSEENMELWKSLMEKGDGSVLRAKIDMSHKNSVLRDPTLFRVIVAEHARQGKKYRLWPNYDFENSVMDGLQNITLRFRTKEFELRTELQRWLQKKLDLLVTGTYEFARFNLQGVESSGRIIREKVQSGELIGWDDPSLTTLAALRRRGFQPEAIKNFVLNTGISKTEATLTWDDLELHNRRVLDEKADRYFFIENPVKITIEGAPEQEVELNLNPGEKKGGRPLKTGTNFYITKKDYEKMKDGKLYRFMECLNFIRKGNTFKFQSTDVEEYKKNGSGIMHWLPTDQVIEVELLMPDKTIKKGLAESNVKNMKNGDVIQFERFGFCRLDSKEDWKFWFTHS